ncbi:hypothetical protein MLD38_024286 [Melastoma candidum]|uniref:Uncharacterized protein n=1 Tax=Melastoma candidum TaxID=119954 RepID=A0ACB9NSU1_9MYRT|nr:hypothetical protein MLD38_024286 [Melastoma candidum]
MHVSVADFTFLPTCPTRKSLLSSSQSPLALGKLLGSEQIGSDAAFFFDNFRNIGVNRFSIDEEDQGGKGRELKVPDLLSHLLSLTGRVYTTRHSEEPHRTPLHRH